MSAVSSKGPEPGCSVQAINCGFENSVNTDGWNMKR
jgi:hypothetical protein